MVGNRRRGHFCDPACKRQESLSKYIEGGRRSVQERMADLLARFERRISPLERRHLLPSDPVQPIPDFALQRGIDLIVMGTVGRTGISGFVMSNTAEKVLRLVRCSVLAVKPHIFISVAVHGGAGSSRGVTWFLRLATIES